MKTTCIAVMAICLAAGMAPAEIVRNPDFAAGGRTWSAGWRPLPGEVRVLRGDQEGRHCLTMVLRGDGDGGVVQQVTLPARRRLSLRMLATAWDTPSGGVVATLIRLSDRQVLCELLVADIVRDQVSRSFDTGSGGPAELMVRLVGDAGGRGRVDWVRIGPLVSERIQQWPVEFGPPERDLVLSPGEALSFEQAPGSPALAAAVEMVQQALGETAGTPATRPGPPVTLPPPGTGASEDYRLVVSPDGVRIEGNARWALMSLIDLMRREPGGGVRIPAVAVSDAPHLPWRGGWVEGPPDAATNAVRRLVRLKLNVALIPATTSSQGEGDWEVIGREACEQALRHGIVPVAVLTCIGQPTGDALRLAAETVARNLPVQYLLLSHPGAWNPTVADAILAALAGLDHPTHVIAVLDAEGRGRADVVSTLDAWPAQVMLACPQSALRSDEVAAAVGRAGRRGVSWLVMVDEDPAAAAVMAASARARGDRCGGLIAPPDDPEPTANAAWRVPR